MAVLLEFSRLCRGRRMALAPDARSAPCHEGPRSADTGPVMAWCRGVRSRPGDPDRHKKCTGPAERWVTPLPTKRQLSTDPAMIGWDTGRFSHAKGTMCTVLVRAAGLGERT